MALFTVPLAISDGTVSRTFDWSHQVPGKLAGVYSEPAASALSNSRLESSHTVDKSGKKRHRLGSSEISPLVNPGDNDPADDSIVVNLTVAHHPKADPTEVEKRVKLLLAAAGTAGFTDTLMRGAL